MTDSEEAGKRFPTILIDGDGCPVKDEVYRVARRLKLPVVLVANRWMGHPRTEGVRLQLVHGDPDAADDWIAEEADTECIVVTGDVPLAYRCVHAGAQVITPRGRVHDESSIGSALATRDLMTQLRDQGLLEGGGPPPFRDKDRQQFLQKLDELVQGMWRASGRP